MRDANFALHFFLFLRRRGPGEFIVGRERPRGGDNDADALSKQGVPVQLMEDVCHQRRDGDANARDQDKHGHLQRSAPLDGMCVLLTPGDFVVPQEVVHHGDEG